MTEVVVSFAVLMLLAVMVSRSFLAAWQMTLGAVKRVQDLEELKNAVCLAEAQTQTDLRGDGSLYFKAEEESGEGAADGFFAEGMVLYRYESEGNQIVLYRLERENER